jgi:hypothetical protein
MEQNVVSVRLAAKSTGHLYITMLSPRARGYIKPCNHSKYYMLWFR